MCGNFKEEEDMDYSSRIRSLVREALSFRSYSRLNQILQIVMFIIMLPFTVLCISGIAAYYALVFIRNGLGMPTDELELWLKQRSENVHFVPKAVLYLVAFPVIFSFKALLMFFSFIFYLLWYFIMASAFASTLGGIRWKPYVINGSCGGDYTWGYKNTNKTLNVCAVICALLFVIALVLNAVGLTDPLIFASFGVVIYAVFPLLFAKKDIRIIESDDDVYEDAQGYLDVKTLYNYNRARKRLSRIPDHKDSSVYIADCDEEIDKMKAKRAKILKDLLIFFGNVMVIVIVILIVVALSSR